MRVEVKLLTDGIWWFLTFFLVFVLIYLIYEWRALVEERVAETMPLTSIHTKGIVFADIMNNPVPAWVRRSMQNGVPLGNIRQEPFSLPNMRLVGTILRGTDRYALLKIDGGDAEIHRRGDMIKEGIYIEEVRIRQVTLSSPAGDVVLELEDPGQPMGNIIKGEEMESFNPAYLNPE